jgi:hypothetical protein
MPEKNLFFGELQFTFPWEREIVNITGGELMRHGKVYFAQRG